MKLIISMSLKVKFAFCLCFQFSSQYGEKKRLESLCRLSSQQLVQCRYIPVANIGREDFYFNYVKSEIISIQSKFLLLRICVDNF